MKFYCLWSNLFVQNMKTKTISSSLHLGDHVSNLLDSINLFTKVLWLEEVTEMSISAVSSNLVHVQQTLVDLENRFQNNFGEKMKYFLQFSPIQEQPPWHPEQFPTPWWLAWRYPGIRPFLLSWLGTPSTSCHALAPRLKLSRSTWRIPAVPGHHDWSKRPVMLNVIM